ncbi:MAG: 50S ribosomal protein L35 [Geminicoccaceae bacterium]
MSKMKTNRAAAKRFGFTGSGKIKRNHAYHRHCLTQKTQNQKVRHRKPAMVAKADEAMIRRLLPNG